MTLSPGALTALPLFPLQSPLFPGGEMPLRIFEVRYLDMIGRRHQSGEPFGVVCLSEGTETLRPAGGRDGRPSGDGFAHEAFFPVGTLARITRFERPQPGLLLIACRGEQRFRVERSEQLKHGLWVGDVSLLADDADVPVPEDLTFTREALRDVLRDIAAQHGDDAAGSAFPEPCRWDDCGWLANRWCELLPLPPDVKHRCMALDSPLLRLELVADTLGRMGVPR